MRDGGGERESQSERESERARAREREIDRERAKEGEWLGHRVTSLIRTPPPLGPYSSPMPRNLW